MISVLVHTYNEEENIARCLSSVDWADEIVVVDMGSTDRTVQLAKSYTDAIYFHPYTGFVEPARNYAIEKATGDWILIIDADEYVSPSLSRHFLQLQRTSPAHYFRVPRKNIIFGTWVKHAGWWPDYQIRFFRKGSVQWTEKIHGVPLTQGEGQDIAAEEATSLVHYHYQSIEQFLHRLNRYTTISAKERFLQGDHISLSSLYDCSSREFITRYFAWEGYKAHFHGLALSLLQSFSETAVQLKLWELEGFPAHHAHLHDIERFEVEQFRKKYSWFVEHRLASPSFFSRFFWRVRRKISRLL